MSFIISGNQVNLRPATNSDISDYERWNKPDLNAWKFDGPWYRFDFTVVINRRKNWLAAGANPPYHSLEIETKSGQHIGWVTVYFKEDDPHKTEIGIDIVEDNFWGKGLGTEAFTLWTNYLFSELRLTRIGFTTWEGNERMVKVGKRLGFIEEARIRKSCFVNGRFYDRISMGILREEWKNR